MDAGGVGVVPDAGASCSKPAWAYELGWGGWWFWDGGERLLYARGWRAPPALHFRWPVTEQRAGSGVDAAAVHLRFSRAVPGHLLVRSGVLVSVHAFASDGARSSPLGAAAADWRGRNNTLVSREVAAARQQRPADGRHAGGAAGHPLLPLGAQTAGAGAAFRWGAVL